MASADTAARAARAAARRTWPVRLVALGQEPPDALRRRTTAEDRLAMVQSLTLEAWTLSGRAMPDYPRSRAVVRLSPLGRRRPEPAA